VEQRHVKHVVKLIIGCSKKGREVRRASQRVMFSQKRIIQNLISIICKKSYAILMLTNRRLLRMTRWEARHV